MIFSARLKGGTKKMADPPSQKATAGQGARDSTRAPSGAASLSNGAVYGEQRKATP